jgi:DNA-binding NtrC family response regulator
MPKTLLLVDDDNHILETAQDILEAAGFTIRTAVNGEGALQNLRDHPCDLMVVDLNLLDMTGIELAVKATELHPELPIVLMTGEANVDLGPAQAVIRASLTKPVNPAKLIEIIRKIVEP